MMEVRSPLVVPAVLRERTHTHTSLTVFEQSKPKYKSTFPMQAKSHRAINVLLAELILLSSQVAERGQVTFSLFSIQYGFFYVTENNFWSTGNCALKLLILSVFDTCMLKEPNFLYLVHSTEHEPTVSNCRRGFIALKKKTAFFSFIKGLMSTI